ncbi:Origin recognition complex, subunit 1 [Massospora cicadina]|nr:Origin recognition complex, subunit 1 [Massospora cicadina]
MVGARGTKRPRASAKASEEVMGRVPEALAVDGGDAFDLVRSRLHVSAVPKTLPGREAELADISAQLYASIQQGSSCCLCKCFISSPGCQIFTGMLGYGPPSQNLGGSRDALMCEGLSSEDLCLRSLVYVAHISGVPGTGKTATVRAAIRELQGKVDLEVGGGFLWGLTSLQELPAFNYLEINGMQVSEPNQTYVKLWEAIGQQTVTHLHALDCLREYFQGKRKANNRQLWVVLVDELDLLMTKKQGVMYNLFEWPYCPNSRLIIVAIANTMDLPERMLTHKVASRMGLIRVVFQPYTHQQLKAIVASRLMSVPWFDPEAVEMCARKVASVSGDARRALDICRRAVEIIEVQMRRAPSDKARSELRVRIATINRAVDDMYKSPGIKYIAACSMHQKVMLAAVLLTVKSQGVSDVSLMDVMTNHLQLCRLSNFPLLAPGRLLQVATSLVGFNILMASAPPASPLTPNAIVTLAIRSDDVSVALRLEERFKSLV